MHIHARGMTVAATETKERGNQEFTKKNNKVAVVVVILGIQCMCFHSMLTPFI